MIAVEKDGLIHNIHEADKDRFIKAGWKLVEDKPRKKTK